MLLSSFLPFPALTSIPTLRGRWELELLLGWGVRGLQPHPLESLTISIFKGFRHLLLLSLIPCPTWLVLKFLFSLVPQIWWSSYNRSSSPVSCLMGLGTEFECKGKLSNCGFWVSGYGLFMYTGIWTRQGKVFVYSRHHDLSKPESKSD